MTSQTHIYVGFFTKLCPVAFKISIRIVEEKNKILVDSRDLS